MTLKQRLLLTVFADIVVQMAMPVSADASCTTPWNDGGVQAFGAVGCINSSMNSAKIESSVGASTFSSLTPGSSVHASPLGTVTVNSTSITVAAPDGTTKTLVTPTWIQTSQIVLAGSTLTGFGTGLSNVGGTVSMLAAGLASIGGVFANAGAPHQWINSVSTTGNVTLAQPAFSDLAGLVASAQLPFGTQAGQVADGAALAATQRTVATAEQSANKGAASGYAGLDGSGHVPLVNLPVGSSSAAGVLQVGTSAGMAADGAALAATQALASAAYPASNPAGYLTAASAGGVHQIGTLSGNITPPQLASVLALAAPATSAFGTVAGTVADGGVLAQVQATANAAYPASNPGSFITASQVPAAPVQSIANRTGNVTLSASDIGGLGAAALLSIGTGANTVAAGNDPRFNVTLAGLGGLPSANPTVTGSLTLGDGSTAVSNNALAAMGYVTAATVPVPNVLSLTGSFTAAQLRAAEGLGGLSQDAPGAGLTVTSGTLSASASSVGAVAGGGTGLTGALAFPSLAAAPAAPTAGASLYSDSTGALDIASKVGTYTIGGAKFTGYGADQTRFWLAPVGIGANVVDGMNVNYVGKVVKNANYTSASNYANPGALWVVDTAGLGVANHETTIVSAVHDQTGVAGVVDMDALSAYAFSELPSTGVITFHNIQGANVNCQETQGASSQQTGSCVGFEPDAFASGNDQNGIRAVTDTIAGEIAPDTNATDIANNATFTQFHVLSKVRLAAFVGAGGNITGPASATDMLIIESLKAYPGSFAYNGLHIDGGLTNGIEINDASNIGSTTTDCAPGCGTLTYKTGANLPLSHGAFVSGKNIPAGNSAAAVSTVWSTGITSITLAINNTQDIPAGTQITTENIYLGDGVKLDGWYGGFGLDLIAENPTGQIRLGSSSGSLGAAAIVQYTALNSASGQVNLGTETVNATNLTSGSESSSWVLSTVSNGLMSQDISAAGGIVNIPTLVATSIIGPIGVGNPRTGAFASLSSTGTASLAALSVSGATSMVGLSVTGALSVGANLSLSGGVIQRTQTTAPSVSCTGTGTPSMLASSTNEAGRFTVAGGAVTSCTVTFVSAPHTPLSCYGNAASAAGGVAAGVNGTSATSITINASLPAAGGQESYGCSF